MTVQRHGLIAAAFISLATLLSCTSSEPKEPPVNKLQEREQQRFWGKPNTSGPAPASSPASAPASGTASTPAATAPPPADETGLTPEIEKKAQSIIQASCGEDPPKASDITKVETLEFGSNGEKALHVTMRDNCVCSAEGNCPQQIWAHDPTQPKYYVTLSDEGVDLRFANSQHNGHYDILTEARTAGGAASIIRYEWDGYFYKAAELSCRTAEGSIVSGKCK